MNINRAYRDIRVDYHSADVRRVLRDAHGEPIRSALAAINKAPVGLPVRNVNSCENWLHSTVASMYQGVTAATLEPTIKSECYRCAQAICHGFRQHTLLQSPDGTHVNRINHIPRPTLWTLHQNLPNRDPDTGTTLAFYLRINDIAQTFVEQFLYQEKRRLILASFQIASTTTGGISLSALDLNEEYVQDTTSNLAAAGITLISYVERVDDDTSDDSSMYE
jgi:hypothetical protein